MIKAAISNLTDGLAHEVSFPLADCNVWAGRRSLGYWVIVTRGEHIICDRSEIQTTKYLIKTIENATK